MYVFDLIGWNCLPVYICPQPLGRLHVPFLARVGITPERRINEDIGVAVHLGPAKKLVPVLRPGKLTFLPAMPLVFIRNRDVPLARPEDLIQVLLGSTLVHVVSLCFGEASKRLRACFFTGELVNVGSHQFSDACRNLTVSVDFLEGSPVLEVHIHGDDSKHRPLVHHWLLYVNAYRSPIVAHDHGSFSRLTKVGISSWLRPTPRRHRAQQQHTHEDIARGSALPGVCETGSPRTPG